MLRSESLRRLLREGFNNPSHGNFPPKGPPNRDWRSTGCWVVSSSNPKVLGTIESPSPISISTAVALSSFLTLFFATVTSHFDNNKNNCEFLPAPPQLTLHQPTAEMARTLKRIQNRHKESVLNDCQQIIYTKNVIFHCEELYKGNIFFSLVIHGALGRCRKPQSRNSSISLPFLDVCAALLTNPATFCSVSRLTERSNHWSNVWIKILKKGHEARPSAPPLWPSCLKKSASERASEETVKKQKGQGSKNFPPNVTIC